MNSDNNCPVSPAPSASIVGEEMETVPENSMELSSPSTGDTSTETINDSVDAEEERTSDGSSDNSNAPSSSDSKEGDCDSGDVDVLQQVIQLIEWVNEKEDRNGTEGAAGSSKQNFMNGYLFIERLQSKFDHHEKAIAEKDSLLVNISEENENLRREVLDKVNGVMELLTRNSELEEIIRRQQQQIRETMSLERLHATLDSLKQYCARVMRKLEQQRLVNAERFNGDQRRSDVDNLKREITHHLCRIQYKLGVCEKNQSDIVHELQGIQSMLEKIDDIIQVTEQLRMREGRTVTVIKETAQARAEINQRLTVIRPLPPMVSLMVQAESEATEAFEEPIQNSREDQWNANQQNRIDVLVPPSTDLNPVSSDTAEMFSNAEIPLLELTNETTPSSDASGLREQTRVPQDGAGLLALPIIPVLNSTDPIPELSQQQDVMMPLHQTSAGNKSLFNKTVIRPPSNRETVLVSPQKFNQLNPVSLITTETGSVDDGSNLPTDSDNFPVKLLATGQNLCDLCGMNFNTLIQMKLHQTVVHLKGSTQASPAVVPTATVAAASQQLPSSSATTLSTPTSLPIQAIRWNMSVISNKIVRSTASPVPSSSVPSPKRLRFSSPLKGTHPQHVSSLSSLSGQSLEPSQQNFAPASGGDRTSSAEGLEGTSSAVGDNSSNSDQLSLFPFVRDNRDN